MIYGRKLSLYLVPGSVLELLFNLILLIEMRTTLQKEVKRHAQLVGGVQGFQLRPPLSDVGTPCVRCHCASS